MTTLKSVSTWLKEIKTRKTTIMIILKSLRTLPKMIKTVKSLFTYETV